MFIKLFLIVVVFSANIIAESDIPSSITHCRRYDPDFAACALKANRDAIKLLKNGYPEKEIESIEPIKADIITIKADPNRSFRLDQTYRNVEINGFTDVIIKEVTGNLDECLFHQKLYIPRIEIHSDYEINGQLLLFTLNGAGKSNVTCKGIAAQLTISCDFFKENDIEYMRFKELKFKLKSKYVYLHFTNLVKGNKELSDVLGNVLNENAIELFNEYSVPYANIISAQLFKIASKMIEGIPVSKLFLPD